VYATVSEESSTIIVSITTIVMRFRKRTNLAEEKAAITRERFWKTLLLMRLTSLQDSGPASRIAQFSRKDPFPLEYPLLVASHDVMGLITATLVANGLKRFLNVIPSQLALNFQWLESGGWEETLSQCNRLTHLVGWETEEEVADYIDEKVAGFGPKQSRNVLQELHLTRYEIPIDSRVTKWLNDTLEFPVKLRPEALAYANYYKFVQRGIRELCQACDLLPCIFDAAVFSLKDGFAWED
jgi:hypothetical protein